MSDQELDFFDLDLKQLWDQMSGDKGSVEHRCEEYARWTLPYICPRDTNSDSTEQEKGSVAIGARLVNHLANKVVDTMFPNDRPFFSLPLTPANQRQIRRDIPNKSEADKKIAEVRNVTEQIVEDGMRQIDLTEYRPTAVEAVKHSIVTGGAIIRRFDDGKRSVYGVKDYATTRDTRGVLTSVMLRDVKKFASLSKSVQADITAAKPGQFKGDRVVEVYTYFERQDEDTWLGGQSIENEMIIATVDVYNDVTLPIIDITWNLARGDNYPRGLVEDNAVLFHNVDVVTAAMIDLMGLAADVKFLVDPASGLDVNELNNSARGTYHPGRDGDVTTIQFQHRLEAALLGEQIAQWERQLAQIFLLGSGTVRDAERVTAEEIRAQARELESAFGGLYSKLAISWQKKEAEWAIAQLALKDYEGLLETFEVVVTTGLESLSREGQLDALRLAIGDLSMLDAVPEDVRDDLDRRAFAEFVFTNRGVNFGQFVLTEDQAAARDKQRMKRERALMQEQGAVDAASRAAGAAQG